MYKPYNSNFELSSKRIFTKNPNQKKKNIIIIFFFGGGGGGGRGIPTGKKGKKHTQKKTNNRYSLIFCAHALYQNFKFPAQVVL